jgi:hypothetical protein
VRTAGIIRWAAAGVLLTGLVAGGLAVLLAPAQADAASTGSPTPTATEAVAHTGATGTWRSTFQLPADDGGAYTPNAADVAIRSRVDSRLLLFLPATNQTPEDYRHFLDTAGDAGYHVLGLDYYNVGTSLTGTCRAVAECYTDFQTNRFDGSLPSRWSAVPEHDSILHRLRAALGILRAQDPTGGWGRYTDGDAVRWDRIVLAGHSQGGGESAFIAHGHAVAGVLMFGSPVESYQGVTAAWMADAGLTSVDRYYALDDADDMYADRIAGSWQALGLPGDTVSIGATPPATLPHRMLTNVDLGTPERSHSCFITDDGPAAADGSALFQPVWRSMLTAVSGTA